MCFHSQQSLDAKKLENRHNAKFANINLYTPSIYKAFQHPKTPVILNDKADTIQMIEWGLIPSWAKDKSIQKYTLNARIESINEKPSFRNYINNRCLILVDGFYEWKWMDAKGVKKQKYFLSMKDKSSFCFAGIWSKWIEAESAEEIISYSVLTMKANALLSEIHNSKKRMPVIINQESEKDWLNGKDYILQNDELIASVSI